MLSLLRLRRFVVVTAAHAAGSVDPNHHQNKEPGEPMRQNAAEDEDHSKYQPEQPSASAMLIGAVTKRHRGEYPKHEPGQNVNRVETEQRACHRSERGNGVLDHLTGATFPSAVDTFPRYRRSSNQNCAAPRRTEI